MDGRAHKVFLLNLFLDDGLNTHISEAVQLVTEDSTFNSLDKPTTFEEDENYPIPRHRDGQFKERFRMQRSSFEKLLQVVGKALIGAEHFRPFAQVSLPEKLLYTLSLLSDNKSFRDVSEDFAIPKSSGHEIFKWVTGAFVALLPRYVKWPADNACAGRGIGMLPGVVGVIDECRIPLKVPAGEEHSCRLYRELTLQAVFDERSRFLDVHIDVPDMQSGLLRSELFERIIDTEQPLMPPDKHLVGDVMYPLLLNLMTPYTNNMDELTPCHKRYNRAVHLWNAPAERGFAALMSRFRRLESLDVNSLELGTIVISATCMLHNFVLGCGESIEDATLDFEMLPENQNNMVFEEHGLINWEHTSAAEKKRDNLVAGFMNI